MDETQVNGMQVDGTQVDGTQVEAFVAALLGRAVVRVARLAGSVANQDFQVDLDDATRVVLKAGPAAELSAEAWACRRLGGLGVPVPEVVALDLAGAGLGLPTLVLGWMEGEPSEGLSVARDAGRLFRHVHAQELNGWGSLVVEDPDPGAIPSGRHESWADAILAELVGVAELVDAGVIDPVVADAARALVAVDDLLGFQGPGVLLHRDLKPAHLFGLGGRLTAVIDWGDAAVGDPDVDLARLSMSGPKMTAAFLAGYGTPLTARLEDRMARYRIAWNLNALCYEYRAGGDWFDTYRDRIRDDVTLLSS